MSNKNVDCEVDLAWKLFNSLVREGFTVRRIRLEMKKKGHDLSKYKDPYLIRRMLKVMRSPSKEATSVALPASTST